MDKHVTIVGYLFIALGIIGIVGAALVFITVAGGGLISGEREAIAITATVASVVSAILLLLSLPSLIGGIGLLRRANWARVVILVLSFVNLLNIPFGTILGIYAIWVLLNDQTAALFQSRNSRPADRFAEERRG